MKALHRILSLLAPIARVPKYIFRTAITYGAKSSGRNDSLQKAGLRESEIGQELAYFYDITASALPATAMLWYFGPFPGGSSPVLSTLRIVGDATTDLGDEIDVGYAFVVSTDGTDDPDAFIDGVNASAGNIDVDGLAVVGPNVTATATIDKPYWITITTKNATGVAAGTLALECFIRTKN